MELKDLIVVPNIADRLRPPVKSDKILGPHKESWCEFHEAFGHHINNCLALGYQLDELVKNGFLKDYLAGSTATPDTAAPEEGQAHEVPTHGEVHTISGGFSGGGPTASQRKKYVRLVNLVAEEFPDDPWEADLVFTRADLRDVVPHDNDSVVISVVTTGRKVHRVLVDQGSSADVMFWTTFNKLQLFPDLLRPYTGCLYGFADNPVEVRGYLELRTTFTDGTASRTESIRYLVVNTNSAYNILLGRPALNRLRAVSSIRHMKMKLPNLSGKVIVIKSDQEEARKCYENSLKTKRGVVMVIERPPVSDSPLELESLEEVTPAESAPVEATLGATPVENAHTEGKNSEASPIERAHGKASPADEVPRIVRAYHTTPLSSTMEAPFSLVYGSDAMIPVEIHESLPRFLGFVAEESNEERRVNLDLMHEAREEAKIKAEAVKRRVERQYSSKVKLRQFQVGDLVMRKAHPYELENKLSPKWTGPFRITKAKGNGLYKLETLEGGPIPRSWNAANLKFYFS